MVTRILFDPRRDLPDGTTISNAVVVEATPTGISEQGAVVIFPTTLTFTISTAADLFQLPPSLASWAWRIVVRDPTTSAVLQQRTVQVPDQPSINYQSLQDVDPATLIPTQGAARQWDATFTQILTMLAAQASSTSTQIAAAVNALVASAPGQLDTLKELADALGDDANFAATMTAALATKATPAQITAAITALSLGSASKQPVSAFDPAGAATAAAGAITLAGLGGTTATAAHNDAASQIATQAQSDAGTYPTLNGSQRLAIAGTQLTPSAIGADSAGAAANAAAASVPITGVVTAQATQYSTSADGTTRVLAQSTPTAFGPIVDAGYQPIVVDTGTTHQPIEGFGAALTDASSYNLISHLTAAQRTALLTEMFSPDQNNLSWVLLPMGASDFAATRYTYDDEPTGTTDPSLTDFSIAPDQAHRIAVLRQILSINPRVRIIAAPWSAPAWMKVDPTVGIAGTSIATGNNLNSTYFAAYAQYFVQWIQAMGKYGFTIHGVYPQNEPLAGTQGWPCMIMSSTDQITFVGTYLGPAFDAAGITTKIFGYKHNWDHPEYPDALLANSTAASYLAGVGWHWYVGHPSPAQNYIGRKYPWAEQHFVEACGSSVKANTIANLMSDIFIGSVRGGSRSVLMWNIALDENGQPMNRNDGAILKGLVTVPSNGSGIITRNNDYIALRHYSQFVKPGAVRIRSTSYSTGVQSCAILNTDGSIVLLVFNSTATAQTTTIVDARTHQGFPITLPAGEAATLTWVGRAAGVTAAPSAPSAPTITATANPGRNIIAITAGTTSAPVSCYTVYRSTTTGQETLLATIDPTVTSYTDAAVTTGTTYFYKVTASSAGGESGLSSEVSATAAAPTAPSAPTLSSTSSNQAITLAWTIPTSNGGAALTGFRVFEASAAGVATTGTPLATVGPKTTTYTDNALTNGTTRYYKVTAVNSAGSTASNEISAAAGAVETRTQTKPSTTAQPQLWLRGDQLAGANGAQITSWADFTTNSYNAVLPSGAASTVAPTIISSAINSLPAASFNKGSQQRLVAPKSIAAENVTVFIVARFPTLGTNVFAAGATSDAHVAGSINSYIVGTGAFSAQTYQTSGAPSIGGGSFTANTFGIAAMSWDTSANSHVMKAVLNGNTVGTLTPSAYTAVTAAGLAIGGVGTTDVGTVDIAEVIVFSACLSDADRHAWNVYLGSVYGITVGAN